MNESSISIGNLTSDRRKLVEVSQGCKKAGGCNVTLAFIYLIKHFIGK